MLAGLFLFVPQNFILNSVPSESGGFFFQSKMGRHPTVIVIFAPSCVETICGGFHHRKSIGRPPKKKECACIKESYQYTLFQHFVLASRFSPIRKDASELLIWASPVQDSQKTVRSPAEVGKSPAIIVFFKRPAVLLAASGLHNHHFIIIPVQYHCDHGCR